VKQTLKFISPNISAKQTVKFGKINSSNLEIQKSVEIDVNQPEIDANRSEGKKERKSNKAIRKL
jgi:hypothetical protein